jgi:hypothetical protein
MKLRDSAWTRHPAAAKIISPKKVSWLACALSECEDNALEHVFSKTNGEDQ